jgi:2-(1,2-epoxy-1,2-dihydrophenyl)acetyl-CoA isomerase
VIESETHQGVSIVRLRRPTRRNALVPEMMEALIEQLRVVAERRQPVVLIGSDGAFCPGADLKWLGTFRDPALGVAELVAAFHTAIVALLDMPAPVIAAVNGIAAGGGMSLALAADYRMAAASATFTTAYFRLGLTPDGGSSLFLERMIGVARSMELLLTNRTLTAREAHDWGLVNEVIPDEELLDAAIARAHNFVAVPSSTLLETRRLFDVAGIRNQLQLESVAIREAAREPAFRGALDKFLAVHGG